MECPRASLPTCSSSQQQDATALQASSDAHADCRPGGARVRVQAADAAEPDALPLPCRHVRGCLPWGWRRCLPGPMVL
eukprot:7551438-Pyramimonas_sp.AAC.1